MAAVNLRIELKNRLPKKRYEHVIRVTETAKKLAEQYDVSVEKAELAALFHDIAKFMEPTQMREIIEREADPTDVSVLGFHHELWHAAAGRLIARDEFEVHDSDILNAIRFHTTGRAAMSKLEKVIYIADLIEPGRDFPGIGELRDTNGKSVDELMKNCVSHSILYLIGKRVAVHPDSIDCYNEHVKKRIEQL
ncbi:bis(5'-nucleosyl)-tetraphosphatase (symmetrical) YqeK [Sporosarcina oncorhynchi]|uniref:bis(5'-nucleosyl)-tetraphosphatase (symmetrical) n=1 Tax=Sporosarcina oncorhynchi TaxID=3056444 RepID=A0ABZ0L8B8_9BACL|nr:bis(5'-nucleosyl)-tetraphosphatase (symmetrical) YqeK [Sporosarcina sp. T2O-4]WOV88794.1 bis(5'-nucleosyl)-tetraphosphatase (symmetrical) YqeK [Sporosarcina sp. T2O-4]